MTRASRTRWPRDASVEDIARDLGYAVERHPANGEKARQAQNTNNAAWWQENYGTDFRGCVEAAQGKVDDPEGFCAQVHHDATGEWPGAKKAALAAADEEFPVPEPYPADWFERPAWLQPGQGHTVLPSGQAAGYWYPRGACIIGNEEACPGPSPTGYRAFKQGTTTVVAAGGEEQQIEVGVIGQVGGHASPDWSNQASSDHYNNPEKARIVCVLGDDEHGGWYAGGLVPGLTRRQVEQVRNLGLSGDWRPMPKDWWERNGIDAQAVREAEGYDSLGPTLVPQPALPMVRAFPRAASAAPVLLGVTLGDDDEAYAPCADCSQEETVSNEANARAAALPPEFLNKGKGGKGNGEKPAAKDGGGSSLEDRVAALERKVAAMSSAGQKQKAAAVAAMEHPELPPPAGFEERTAGLTEADRAWIAAQPSPKSAPDRPAEQRKKDSDSGVAMKGGGYPIRNAGDLENAKPAIGRAAEGDRAAVIAHINKRAKELGLPGVGGGDSGAKKKQAA